MFTCRIFIAPDGPTELYEDLLHRDLERLAGRFQQLSPKVQAKNHSVEFQDVTRDTVEEIEAFLQSEGDKYRLGVEETPLEAELVAARYVLLPVGGAYISTNRNGEPLNRYPRTICETCGAENKDFVPDPYLVSEENVRRIQDIYLAEDGIIIVSERFMALAGNRLAEHIRFGDVRIVRPAARTRLKDSYHWILPKYSLGKESRSKVLRHCSSCGTPIEIREISSGDKFNDAQIILEHFAPTPHPIALSGNWYGQRELEKPTALSRRVFISGEVYSFLATQKLSGIVRPTHIAVDQSRTV